MPLSPEQTNTYYIFLASPGDMGEERQAVRDLFERYSRYIARHRGLRFQVVDYENYADIGVGRPQEIINRNWHQTGAAMRSACPRRAIGTTSRSATLCRLFCCMFCVSGGNGLPPEAGVRPIFGRNDGVPAVD